MYSRIDYYDDPHAPPATRLVPSANVVVTNDNGHILLILRPDTGWWSLPGGAMALGESLPDAACREVLEETGIYVEITGLVGTYTDPRHVIAEPGSSEVRQECTIVFSGRPIGGELTTTVESIEVRWVPPDRIYSLPMSRHMLMRVTRFLAGEDLPYVG